MKKSLTTALLAATLLTSTLATPASAQKGKNETSDGAVTLLSESTLAWSVGASQWVNLLWTADTELENVEVRVGDLSPNLEVEYPSDGEFSRLGVDGTLSPSEIDFTAVKFTTTKPGEKFATVEMSWDGEDGRDSKTFRLRLTNRLYKGDDFAILTETATATTDVANGQANWIDLDYKGIAPTTSSMKMSITTDLPVYYPQDSFTSLHHDEVLHSGEADVARVWFDPELITAGSYDLTVDIDYVDTNGETQTTSHVVTLNVS